MSRAVTKNRAARPPADRRKLLMYGTLGVVVLAVLIGVGLASRQVVPKAASNAPIQAQIKPGQQAPTFTVQTNAGPFDLAQVTTPVLLEVFATWCPHCQRETAVMNDLAGKYAGKVAILAVSGSEYGMDGTSAETQADVYRFGQQFQVRYPLAFDPTMSVAQKYLQGGYPTLVVIDASKTIRWVQDGEIPEGDIATQLDKALAGKS